jgi:hypothetical protein
VSPYVPHLPEWAYAAAHPENACCSQKDQDRKQRQSLP